MERFKVLHLEFLSYKILNSFLTQLKVQILLLKNNDRDVKKYTNIYITSDLLKY